jgi:superfamily II DNA helicase RecQ
MAEATAPSDKELLRVLKRSFGYASFKPNQHEIIRAILGGRDGPRRERPSG